MKATGSQPAWLLQGATGVWTFMCAMHSLFSPLWYDSPSLSSKSNGACAWLCIGLVRAGYTSSEICAKWYHGCSYCLVASEADLDLTKALFPCNLPTFSHTGSGWVCGHVKAVFVCIFRPYTVRLGACERLLSAFALAGGFKVNYSCKIWIHANGSLLSPGTDPGYLWQRHLQEASLPPSSSSCFSQAPTLQPCYPPSGIVWIVALPGWVPAHSGVAGYPII